MTYKNRFQSRLFSLSIPQSNAGGTGALLALLLALLLGGAACLPADFSFDEPTGVGSSQGSGGGGSGGSGGAAGSGGAPDPCGSESQCEAVPPEGWEGYFVVTLDAFPGSGAVSCPGGVKPLEYFAAPSPATCSGCPCEVNGAECSPSTLSCYYTDDACTDPPNAAGDNADALCADLDELPADINLLGSCQITAESTVLSNGSCSPGTSDLMEPEPWGETVYACPPSPSLIECGPNQVCAPAPFEKAQYICIARPGEDACPDGFINIEIQAFEGGSDTRSCGLCGCGPIFCDNGVFEIYDGAACTEADSPVVSITEPGCVMIPEYFDTGTGSVKTIPPSPVTQCFGGGGQGLVETTGPIKFCCK